MRDWTFKIDEYAVINENAKQYLPQHVGELIQIFELKTKGINDYTVKLRNGDFVFVKENELNKITDEVVKIYHAILKGNWKVFHVPTNEEVTIVMIDLLHNQAEITHKDGSMEVVNSNTLKLIEKEVDNVEEVTSKYAYGDNLRIVSDNDLHSAVGNVKDITMYDGKFEYKLEIAGQENHLWFVEDELELEKENEGAIMVEKETGKFEKIATELGQFTDKKNKQYGSSVDATYEMIKVLMDRYKNEDDTYTIPQSLLQHLLLQVRMMDKLNRLFQNPSGKGDSESPYKDLVGYSLIGVEMVDRNKN